MAIGLSTKQRWRNGLGICRAVPLALSAFLASAAGTLDLQDEILSNAVVTEECIM